MHVHWLEVGGMNVRLADEDKQWNNLQSYVKKYPESKTTVFIKNMGRDLFARVVKLECKQNYQELDLDCNSGFKERSVEEPIGTMIAMLISYSRKYKKKYEQNNYSMDWFWKTFDSIIKQNKSTIDNYNLIWKIENQ